MAYGGISKYRPQFYTPRYASEMNKAAVQAYRDSVTAAADMFSAQMSDMGSGMVNISIQRAVDRIQKQAAAKMAAAQKTSASINKTV
jgi:hypothetical protein